MIENAQDSPKQPDIPNPTLSTLIHTHDPTNQENMYILI